MSAYKELVDRYERAVSALEAALEQVPLDALDRAPAPGKWSIRQLAAHLADAETVGAVRFRFIVAEPGSPLKAFNQDKWAAALAYGSRSPQESLDLFRAARRSTTTILRGLPEAAWSRTGIHEEAGELTLPKLLEKYVTHADHHIAQIGELRKKFAAPAQA